MVTRLTYDTHGMTETIPIEIVSMELAGDIGEIPVVIQTNPNLTSPGETTIRKIGNGNFVVDSFFDVFTEISIEGGPWEVGPEGPVQTENTLPENEFKWLQLPDIEWGYDIWSWGHEDPSGGPELIVNEVADDWRCADGRPITDIHWWGSFKGWNQDVPPDPATGMPVPNAADLPLYFILSMHMDAPENTNYSWSSPDTKIRDVRAYIAQDQVSIVYYDSNPLLDHATGETVTGLWEHEYEFFVDLRVLGVTWEQTEGEIYWIDIVAIYPEQIETAKWSQLPDMEYGYDIWSWGSYDPPDTNNILIMNEVADDWKCLDGEDITGIRWWGSFREWCNDRGSITIPPHITELPEYFLLSMHKDDRYAGQWSQPEYDPIKKVLIPISEVTITYFDINHLIDHSTGDTKPLWEHEYQFEVTLDEPWPQTAGEIYWLDIVGIYSQSYTEPHHVFGWKTADPNQTPPDPYPAADEDGWIDDAVSSCDSWTNYPLWPGVNYPPNNWYEMVYGPGSTKNPANGLYYAGGWNGYWGYPDDEDTSVNMSFQLFTESDTGEPNHVFGWKTADPRQNPPDPDKEWIDDAVSSNDPWGDASIDITVPYPPTAWYEMVYGPMDGVAKTNNNLFYSGGWNGYWGYQTTGEDTSINMAFGLTTLPIEEPDPQKWVQNPDTYLGYDIWSWGVINADHDAGDTERYIIINEVAEDWRCLDGRAITTIKWWGSFEGFMEDIPEGDTIPVPDSSLLPDAFLLSMHDDLPEGQGQYPYSCPLNPPIKTVEVPINKVKIKYFDSNPSIDHTRGETITGTWEHEYEFEVVLSEPWTQIRNKIYWLDVVGLYKLERVIEEKWYRPPDMGLTGIDIRAEHPIAEGGQVVADDWQCNDPREIVVIRWWGSYLNSAFEPDAASPARSLWFEISWHDGDTVAIPGDTPGSLMYKDFVLASEKFYGVDGTGKNIYQYTARLNKPFPQTDGGIYWIDIELDVYKFDWPYQVWGWHNTNQPWRYTACTSLVSHNGPYTHIQQDMAFALYVGKDVGHVFGWKTADPNDTPPDSLTGTWIDDAVSSNDMMFSLPASAYPPTNWIEMRHGKTGSGYFGGVLGHHYFAGVPNPSVGMAFVLDTKPMLKIIQSPDNSNDARLLPIVDPSASYSIWYNFNMVSLGDPSWVLFGNYVPPTPSFIDDPGAIDPNLPPKRKFYVLKE